MSDFESQPTSSQDPASTEQASTENSGERVASDLDVIESDLAAVEAALNRLDAGTYWTDEVTGEPIPEQLLEADPLVRRVPR